MRILVRKFERTDIPLKVEWVNDPENNAYLHYDLPLETGKTQKWFDEIADRRDRYDGFVEADGTPAGLIGLLNIDRKNSKAEYYILIGNKKLKRKGIAEEASKEILDYGFQKLGLNRIYLYTETGNVPAQRLFEKVGFVREGLLKGDVLSHGAYADRYVYAVLREEGEKAHGKDGDSGSGTVS